MCGDANYIINRIISHNKIRLQVMLNKLNYYLLKIIQKF